MCLARAGRGLRANSLRANLSILLRSTIFPLAREARDTGAVGGKRLTRTHALVVKWI